MSQNINLNANNSISLMLMKSLFLRSFKTIPLILSGLISFHCDPSELNSCFWRSEFIILSRAQRADHARIARQLRFRFGRKSFYRFGIRSCLATSHKQILKTQLNMTWSCILGFQATRPATWAHFIHPLFIVRQRIAKYFCGKKQRAANTTVPNWTSGRKSLPWES